MVQATNKHCFLRANPVFLACVTGVTGIFSHFSGKQRHRCKASKERQTSVTGEGESDTPRSLSACLHSPEKRKKYNACFAGYVFLTSSGTHFLAPWVSAYRRLNCILWGGGGRGPLQSVNTALDCRVECQGPDDRGRTNT